MVKLKRGDTFRINCVANDEDGSPYPGGIAAWTITSVLRKKDGTLIDTFVVSITDADLAQFVITESASGVTSAWPVGVHKMDIKYVIAGDVVHTEDIPVRVMEGQA